MLEPCQTRAHLATKRRETTRDPLRGVKPLQGSLLTFTLPSPATGCRRPPIGGVLRPGRLIRLCGWLLTGLVSKLSIWRRLNKENCLSFSPLRGNNQLAHYPILPCLRTVFRILYECSVIRFVNGTITMNWAASSRHPRPFAFMSGTFWVLLQEESLTATLPRYRKHIRHRDIL